MQDDVGESAARPFLIHTTCTAVTLPARKGEAAAPYCNDSMTSECRCDFVEQSDTEFKKKKEEVPGGSNEGLNFSAVSPVGYTVFRDAAADSPPTQTVTAHTVDHKCSGAI